jgi:dihydroorotate dehydrogenase
VYRLFFDLVLRRLPTEWTHHAAFAVLRFVMALPGVKAIARRWLRPRAPELAVRALGLDLPGPVGLAAGFDKDARGYEALGALGFGFVEIGTVTAQAQPGNPRPRMFRLPADRALINRLGFNNGGAAAAAERLRAPRTVAVGVNIGKTKVVPEEAAVADYVASTEALGALADYFVVNVSSPNTPGLRSLQAVEKLAPLLSGVRQALDRAVPGRRVPLLVKIAPDLADEDVDEVADLALRLGLDGIIATNTTIARGGLRTPEATVQAIGAGGLSGAPLKARALEVLRRLRQRVGDRLVLIAVGGIETADDAWARIRAGATLVQVYTGFVYGGPLTVARLHRGLARKVREAGLPSIAAAVGLDAATAAAPPGPVPVSGPAARA